jgi:hypothetical protein
MGNETTGDAFREWMRSLPDERHAYRERGEIAGIMLRNRIVRGSFRAGPLLQAVLAGVGARKKEIVRGGVG